MGAIFGLLTCCLMAFVDPLELVALNFPSEWKHYQSVENSAYQNLQTRESELDKTWHGNRQGAAYSDLDRRYDEMSGAAMHLGNRLAGPAVILALCNFGLPFTLGGAFFGASLLAIWKSFRWSWRESREAEKLARPWEHGNT